MIPKCCKCEVAFTDNNSIKCFGGCEKMFHFGCSSLPIAHAKLCNNNRNINFVCDDCLANPNNQHCQIETLVKQLSEVSNLLTNMFSNFKAVSNNLLSQGSMGSVLKDNNNITVVPNTSGLSDPQDIISGTDVNSKLEMVKPKKYLHVSNFKPTTSCEDIRNHLQQKLCIPADEIECHELVSKAADRSLLNFISFKVGLDSSMFDKAFDGSIWPLECAIKPFINIRRQRKFPAPATLPHQSE